MNPALCPVAPGPLFVSFGRSPSFHRLRRDSKQDFVRVVRLLRRYYETVRLLGCVHVGSTAFGLVRPSQWQVVATGNFRGGEAACIRLRRPGFRDESFRPCAGSLTPRCQNGTRVVRAVSYCLPPDRTRSTHLSDLPKRANGAELNGWPGHSSVNASPTLSRESAHDSRPNWFAIPLFVRNFHPLLSSGFYRRFPCPLFLSLVFDCCSRKPFDFPATLQRKSKYQLHCK